MATMEPGLGVAYGTDLGLQDPACTGKRHGTYSAYACGCRCPHAREAHRLYMKRHREGRAVPLQVDGTGTRRRIQALWALGHTAAEIGLATGGNYSAANVYVIAKRQRVNVRTKAAIDSAYRALADRPGTSIRNRSRAHAAGYAPPLAWDDDTIDDPEARPDLGDPSADVVDEVAIHRALAGDRVRLTRTEVFGAVAAGRANCLSAAQIGDRLHVTERTVQRIAARIAA